MTRKHFQFMAEYIGRHYRLDSEVYSCLATFGIAIGRQFNPRFNAERFLAACEKAAKEYDE